MNPIGKAYREPTTAPYCSPFIVYLNKHTNDRNRSWASVRRVRNCSKTLIPHVPSEESTRRSPLDQLTTSGGLPQNRPLVYNSKPFYSTNLSTPHRTNPKKYLLTDSVAKPLLQQNQLKKCRTAMNNS